MLVLGSAQSTIATVVGVSALGIQAVYFSQCQPAIPQTVYQAHYRALPAGKTSKKAHSMQQYAFRKNADFYGPDTEVAYVDFTTVDGAAPTINESQGVVSVTRTGEGTWDILLARAWKHVTPVGSIQASNLSHVPVFTTVTPSTRKVTMKLMAITDGTTADDDPGSRVHCVFISRVGV